jgi:outer membrane protein
MKRISLFLCYLILSMSQFAFAADDAKGNIVEPKANVVEPKTNVLEPKTNVVEPIVSTTELKVSAGEVKIGSVDLPQVAEKSEAGAKAMVTLKEMYEKFQATVKKKEQELEKLKTALQAKNLTAANREAKEKQFQKKFGEYQQFGKNAQQEFAKKQAELSKQVKDDLDRLVKDYGRDHGYTLILNKEGLVYSDSKFEVKDLTDEIIKITNGAGKK